MKSYMKIRQWEETEITLEAESHPAEAYTKVQVWAEFVHSSGRRIRRPAFWDGDNLWKIRFSSPLAEGHWEWKTFARGHAFGLDGTVGKFECAPNPSSSRFAQHGLLKMSPGMRSVVHADGHPFLIVADTAWAIPFRATTEECEIYAADRQDKGFNAALMMVVQPDRKATGPRERGVYEGFEVGFEDLPEGHINQLVPEYFQYLDKLTGILLDHGIVPIYQPVFHGFGWKGQGTAGNALPPEEYARFCQYLVARYGARPAFWLIGGDGKGDAPAIPAGGEAVQEWDAYGQPTGLHYCPHGNNKMHQEADWLDFQWCQTGHSGMHRQDNVAEMWCNQPAKGVANAEPTYERMGHKEKALGWWQGHEAWMNLLSGGVMGVFYGAGSLWQWRIDKNEPGFQSWTNSEGLGWREALDLEGSRFVGNIGKILYGLLTTDMEKRDDYSYGHLVAAVPGKFIVAYMAMGGGLSIIPDDAPRNYSVINPKTTEVIETGTLKKKGDSIKTPFGEPHVVILQ